MQNAINISQMPFRSEARDYCERCGIDSLDDMERVRLSMCVRELQERMRPWYDQLVKLHPSMYSVTINDPLPKSYLDLQAQVAKIRQHEAEKLGISV
jgi:hypothetical protein